MRRSSSGFRCGTDKTRSRLSLERSFVLVSKKFSCDFRAIFVSVTQWYVPLNYNLNSPMPVSVRSNDPGPEASSEYVREKGYESYRLSLPWQNSNTLTPGYWVQTVYSEFNCELWKVHFTQCRPIFHPLKVPNEWYSSSWDRGPMTTIVLLGFEDLFETVVTNV